MVAIQLATDTASKGVTVWETAVDNRNDRSLLTGHATEPEALLQSRYQGMIRLKGP